MFCIWPTSPTSCCWRAFSASASASCERARATDHFGQAPIVLAVLLGFVVLFPVQVRHGARLVGIFGSPALPVWISLPLVFVLVTAAMALVAEGVARTFATFPPLAAYRLDILGSLLGIAAFSGLAFLHSPPVVWGAVVAAAFLLLLRRSLRSGQIVALLAIMLLLGGSLSRSASVLVALLQGELLALASRGGGDQGQRSPTPIDLPHEPPASAATPSTSIPIVTSGDGRVMSWSSEQETATTSPSLSRRARATSTPSRSIP